MISRDRGMVRIVNLFFWHDTMLNICCRQFFCPMVNLDILKGERSLNKSARKAESLCFAIPRWLFRKRIPGISGSRFSKRQQ